MRRDEALALLKRRIQARKEGDPITIKKIDRQIASANSKGEWPNIRADSSKPISKPPEPEYSYIKSPPPKNWEA